MFIDSCSDEFVQVWFPSVRLTDVLSLQQQMIYCVVGPRVESVDSSRSFRPLLCPHVRTFKHFASLSFIPFILFSLGCKMAQLKEMYQVLGSIHHQFTLQNHFSSPAKVQMDFCQGNTGSAAQMVQDNRAVSEDPISELQILLLWGRWRGEVRG